VGLDIAVQLATSVVACQNGTVPTALEDARRILDDYGRRWLVWNRVESLPCKAVSECLDAYRMAVEQIIRASDSRDVQKSGAGVAFVAYKAPHIPTGAEILWATPVGFNVLEAAVTQLYEIENSIGAAQALRESAAIKKLESATKRAENAKRQIDTTFNLAVNSFMPMTRRDKCEYFFNYRADAKGPLGQAHDQLVQAKDELVTAARMAVVIKQNVDEQAGVVATQDGRSTDIAQFCAGS
jgi:hypothetical protein